MDDFAEADLGEGGVLRIESEGIAVWTGHPSIENVWFSYFDGEIAVKNPDEQVVRKMLEVASALDARVQGDDGEFYGADGQPLPAEAESPGNRRAGFLGRLLGRS